MTNPDPIPAAATAAPRPGADAPVADGPGATQAATPAQAATAPPTGAVSAAENPAPQPLVDSAEAALGRRILSTAFVRIGAGEPLRVELHDGRTLLLRDVVMGPKQYCGVQAGAGATPVRYCGGYAEVAAARPGSAPGPGSDHGSDQPLPRD